MKKFLMAAVVLAFASAPAFAGPNAGGMLVVHDTGLTYTIDSESYPSPAPECAAVDNQVELGVPDVVWKIYAAFPAGSSPRLKALALGEVFGNSVYCQGGGLPDPAMDFEVAQNGWPTTSGGGAGLSFGTTKTDLMNECYWFHGYGYGSPGQFCAAPHPVQETVFVDDAVPATSDPIADFGCLGFGMPGDTPCPIIIPPGACCFPDGHCEMLLQDVCLAQGGVWYGGDCTPDLCPPPVHTGACCIGTLCVADQTQTACEGQGGTYMGDDVLCTPTLCNPIPVEETTWGQIKNIYR